MIPDLLPPERFTCPHPATAKGRVISPTFTLALCPRCADALARGHRIPAEHAD